jgi:hypothetical protein
MLWGTSYNQINSYNFIDMYASDSHNLKSKSAYEKTKLRMFILLKTHL